MGRPLSVEVVYARAERQIVVALQVDTGTSVREAVERSGLLARCPEIDLGRWAVGTFGRTRGVDEPVQDRDRLEIYRPLLDDPKELRRKRARRR